MKLLQIDIAVRDSRADSLTGWLFGSFVYQADAPGMTAWDKMVPIGLMWGNDPEILEDKLPEGVTLRESWINPDLKLPHYGRAGRMNGPVDNPSSSCLSCHSTAQYAAVQRMTPDEQADREMIRRYFRNLKPGEPFDEGQMSLDYSLQLSVGIQNFYNHSR